MTYSILSMTKNTLYMTNCTHDIHFLLSHIVYSNKALKINGSGQIWQKTHQIWQIFTLTSTFLIIINIRFFWDWQTLILRYLWQKTHQIWQIPFMPFQSQKMTKNTPTFIVYKDICFYIWQISHHNFEFEVFIYAAKVLILRCLWQKTHQIWH